MVRLFGLIRRSGEWDHDGFIKYWTGEHSKQGKRLPGLRKYVIHDLYAEETLESPRWDCLIEMDFDNKESYDLAFGSREWQAGEADMHYNDERIILLSAKEYVIVPDLGDKP